MRKWNSSSSQMKPHNRSRAGNIDGSSAGTTGAQGCQLAALGFFVVLLYVMNLAGPGMTHVITTVWPVLGSLRAMDRQSVDLQQKWLGYWMLYAFVNSFEWIFARLQKSITRIYLLKLLLLAVCALPYPMCPARLVYTRYLRRRIWLDGAGVPPASSPAMTSTAVDHLSTSRTSDGHESPSRKKQPQHPPKKPVPAAKKGK
ncbi:uncharacterized protein LOC119391895 [Rhipicephalus sanguineus]|uniref:uncharacterized protein LOC119391895 n=1 Tax=Rhipicephalus sanguineus TaxID=34632 RepID=UPI0018956CA0|nr:uncharacterized protein LOC119391895 [Rhipicephalus sanguineus]